MSNARSLLTSVGHLPPFQLVAAGFEAHEQAFFKTMAARLQAEFTALTLPGYSADSRLLDENLPVILVVNASQTGFDVNEIRVLRKANFQGGILGVFERASGDGDSIAEAYEAGADEFVRLPLSDAIVTIRIMALVARRVADQELRTAHARLTELFHFVHNDLATPLATLQLSLAALDKMEHSDEKVSRLISRCSRAATSMSETLQLSLPEFKDKAS